MNAPCVSILVACLAHASLALAQLSPATVKPSLTIVEPDSKTGSPKVYVFVPIGYEGPGLTLVGPMGKEETVEVIKPKELPAYLNALTALDNFVAPLSLKQALGNSAAIAQLDEALSKAARDSGVSEARSPAIYNAAVSGAASILSGGSVRASENAEDRLLKKQSLLTETSLVDSKGQFYPSAVRDAASWNAAKKGVRQCKSMVASLASNEKFAYCGKSATPGTWLLKQGGQEIARKNVH